VSRPVQGSSAAGDGLSRRRLVQAAAGLAGFAGWGLGAGAQASTPTLWLSASLKDELAEALKMQQPLVVMVSLEGCPFCKVARQNYLVPLHQEQGVHVTQVDMRSDRAVTDFEGKRVTHDVMSRAWKIRIAPTVLFFGRGGVEVAERLVGGYIPDFYGAYLDERLQQARAAVR
jgi:hypothetical protein